MKAVRFHRHGDADVLVYEDAPDPPCEPGQVLVRVRACALNHLDLWQRRGLERVEIPFPHISGADVAGEIVEVGRGVDDWRPGARVMLQPGLSCGRCAWCLSGTDNRCARYDVLGYQSDGGYAELVRVPAANLIALPEAIDFVTAAAFPLAFITAWHMLMTRAQMTERDTVLVLAAGSGVGQAAVQIGKAFGARVIATAGGEAKLAKARALGADEVVDHYRDDLVACVRKWTGRKGVDIVIEHVGAATWELRHLFARQLSFIGSYMGTKSELIRASALFFAGSVRPVVDRTFALSEAGHAQRHLESGSQFGKVVLVM
jgi:NADPH:quinone reductase-like Zn-dependent oxidoreductase